MKKELYNFDKDRRQDTNTGLITIAIVIATIFMLFGLFIGIESGKDIGYKSRYKEARKLYECDHDRAECEILSGSHE